MLVYFKLKSVKYKARMYLVGLGLIALFITASPLLKTIKFARTYATFYFCKGSGKTTLFNAVLILAFLVANVLCITINLIASRYRIRLSTYTRIHRWLRRVAIVKGLIYTAAAISLRKPNLPIILLSSITSIRQYAYEIFSKLHLILSAIVIATIYLYSPSKELSTPLAIFIATPYRREIPVPDAVYIYIQLLRPWKPRAGQISYTSFTQSHPFYISYGFTRSLFLYANNDLVHNSKIRAVIKGLYRNELNLKLYGMVLLFATGIGILLKGYYNYKELDFKLHAAWVANIMVELLSRDINKRGDIIYPRERISITYTVINAKSLIRSKIKGRKGLYINNKTSDKIREIVRCILDKGIYLKELDFCLYSPRGHNGWLRSVFNLKRSKDIGGSV
ncbi:hypothetical protein V2W45_1466042 [Cenococcum geophilum]